MSIYWVWSYYGKPGKVTEYVKWLNSDEAKLFGFSNREGNWHQVP